MPVHLEITSFLMPQTLYGYPITGTCKKHFGNAHYELELWYSQGTKIHLSLLGMQMYR